MAENYNISEIFYSIQGEGEFTGTATIFIRFYGCNLSCSFCDEPKHTTLNISYSFNDILEKIKDFPSKHISITGGEPSLYNLNNFIDKLQKNGYFITIETNGLNIQNIRKADYIICSPKVMDINSIPLNVESYKLIVNINNKIEILSLAKELRKLTNKDIYLQPENFQDKINFKNLNALIDEILKDGNFKLSVQLHKFLNIA